MCDISHRVRSRSTRVHVLYFTYIPPDVMYIQLPGINAKFDSVVILHAKLQYSLLRQ